MALTQVKSDGIATGAVTATQIAANAVTVDDIADGSISTAKLADDAVTADKLADTAVTAGSYTFANVTVDAQGRITAASSGTVSSDAITEGNTSAEVVDTGSDGHFKVVTEGTEALRVDASRRLLVGTSTAPSVGDSAESRIVVQGKIGADTAAGYMSLARGQAATALTSAGTELGQLVFSDSTGGGFASIRAFTDAAAGTGDYPGRLVFSTTADSASAPTERLRIANTGAFGLSGANYGTSGQVLTSQGSGSAPQWATPSGGSILQVVSTGSTTTVTNGSTNSTSLLSASITPSNSSNKVLIIVQLGLGSSGGSNSYTRSRVWRGSIGGTELVRMFGGTGNGSYSSWNHSFTYLDSPSTTSSTTYTLSMSKGSGSTNDCYTEGLGYHLILMEVNP